jgi:hypothetical protein
MALRRGAQGGVPIVILTALLGGCGGTADSGKPGAPANSTTSRKLVFVGFDASPPLVSALKQ